MADRVVKVTLTAQVAGYQAEMQKAAKATAAVAKDAENAQKVFGALGKGMVVAGGLMAAGIGVAVAKFADFDQAMSNVAATGEDAKNSMDALRQAAIDAGASTVFSATESANAIEELAKAGISAKGILGGGLAGALDLAAAGGLGVADAAGIAATAMQQFGLGGDKASHVADLLAAGAGKAMGDVSDLSQALGQAGLVANSTGLTIEETTAALSAFASKGLLGSDAGTSFKAMLQRLTPQSEEASKQMEALGISAYNAQGEFIGLEAFSGNLQTSLKDLTTEQRNAALGTIFGSDAIRAANVLYEEGAKGIADWTDKVDDSGYAAETAATRLDNLKGDWEALTGAVDSALITMGSAADGPLRGFVQGLTGLVDGFNDLPEGAQQAAFWIGAVASATALAGGTYLVAIPKLAEYNAALATMGPNAQKASRGLASVAKVGGGVLAGLGLGVVAVDLLTTALDQIGPSADEVQNSIKTATDSAELFDTAMKKVVSNLGQGDMEKAAGQVKNLGNALTTLNDGSRSGTLIDANTITNVQRVGVELGKLAETDLPSAQRQFAMLSEAAGLNEKQQQQLLDVMGPYRDELVKAASDQDIAADSSALLAMAMGEGESAAVDNTAALNELAGQAADTGSEVEGLSDIIRDFGSAQIDVMEAESAFEQALDDVTASVKENGESLDLNGEKGRANQDALIGLADASKEFAAATYDQTGSQEQANEVLANGRAKLIDMLGAFGITGDKAEAYADKLGLIPGNINTAVTANTTPAQQAVDAFIRNNSGKRINVAVGVGGQGGITKATGGAIVGPGTGTSDDIPAWLSNGEHVLTAADVAAMGGQSRVYAWRDALHKGDAPKFAGGGAATLAGANDAVQRAEAKLRRAKSDKARKAARDALADAKADLADIRADYREDQRDYNRSNRRGENRAAGMNGNGLSLVDQLIDAGRGIGGKTGDRLLKEANRSEKQYLKLEKAAERAETKLENAQNALDGLADKSKAMFERVSASLRSFFNLGEVGAAKTETVAAQKSLTVGGSSYQWSETTQATTEATAASIVAGTKAKADQIRAFAQKLKKLRAMGFNGVLLEEIAMLGVENGSPVADALLSATASEVSQLNDAYKYLDTVSAAGGQAVADANFAALITEAEKTRDAAQKNSDNIEKALKKETDRILVKLTTALKVGAGKAAGGRIVGPGTSTSDSILTPTSTGEHVWDAAAVAGVGGHAVLDQMRSDARSGRLVRSSSRYMSSSAGGSDLDAIASRFEAAIRSLPRSTVTLNNPVTRDPLSDLRAAADLLDL